MHMILWAPVHVRPWAPVHVPPRARNSVVDVLRVCLSFFPTHSCGVNLAMALGHLMSTSGVLLKSSLYHRPESPEHWSLQWLGEEICIHFFLWSVFQWQVLILNTILNRELLYLDVIFLLCTWLLPISPHGHSTHVILVEFKLLRHISLSIKKLSRPQAIRLRARGRYIRIFIIKWLMRKPVLRNCYWFVIAVHFPRSITKGVWKLRSPWIFKFRLRMEIFYNLKNNIVRVFALG